MAFLNTVFNFWQARSGNFATILGIAMPVVLGTAALATDMVLFEHQKAKLQIAADAAALASVRELSLAGADKTKVESVAKDYAETEFFEIAGFSPEAGDLAISADADIEEGTVALELSFTWTPFFAQYLSDAITPIRVRASARLAGESLTCVIGMMQPQTKAKASIFMDNKSSLVADRCAIYSNSTSSEGLRLDSNAVMNSPAICTAGGYKATGSSSFSTAPITDCPKIDDPLSHRMPPSHGGCGYSALVVNSDTDLDPGVYCDGLTISGTANVTLKPGIYVIKDGPLKVTDSASMSSTGASFYLTGTGSVFSFDPDTSIDLAATSTGSLAGMLFYEDRNVPYSFDFNPSDLTGVPTNFRMHRISSNNARNLLGTIYLSRSVLMIDADAPVADISSYTAIVAGMVWLKEGPTLTLNADYTETAVPVPDGLIGTKPTLTQ